MNTSSYRLTAQALALEPDGYRTSMPGLTHLDASEHAFDGLGQIIDIYTCLSTQENKQYVTAALKPSSIENLGGLPQETLLDDHVLYEIHALAAPDLLNDTLSYSYQFRIQTRFHSRDKILQSFLGMIQEGDDQPQTFGQAYTVTRVNHQYHGTDRKTVLGTGMVMLEESRICDLEDEHRACIGRWDEGIDIDIPSTFFTKDSSCSENPSNEALNPPMLVLQIPLTLFGGEDNIDGMYATKKSLNWGRHPFHQTPSVIGGR